MGARIRRYFITGLLVWTPILVTLFVIRFIFNLLNSSLNLLPLTVRPDIPGLGIILSLAVLFLTGMFTTNLLGQKLMDFGELWVNRIPLVRSIYTGVKQMMETLFSPSGAAFRRVLLIRYPHHDSWTVAFQTGNSHPIIDTALGKEMLSVFVPTTPNPTSGFFILVPKEDAIFLDITTDQALKFVISLGVVQPNTTQKNTYPHKT